MWILFPSDLLQILFKILPQVQSELPEECRQPAGHAQVPGTLCTHTYPCMGSNLTFYDQVVELCVFFCHDSVS